MNTPNSRNRPIPELKHELIRLARELGRLFTVLINCVFKQTVSALCADVAPDILQDFLSRMDREYFRRFEPAIIAKHVRLTAQLTPDHPCEITIAERLDQHFDLTLVAYDYFSAFANICGLLSAFGLNIEEGQIYTFADSSVPATTRGG